jgi:hypothetical protein
MSSDIPPVDSLRRTRSTGDMPVVEISRIDRAVTATHRYSASHSMPPVSDTTAINAESPVPETIGPSRQFWSPIVAPLEEEEHTDIPSPTNQSNTGHRHRHGLGSDILAFFGYGHASASRRELVSVVFVFVWSFIQVRRYFHQRSGVKMLGLTDCCDHHCSRFGCLHAQSHFASVGPMEGL